MKRLNGSIWGLLMCAGFLLAPSAHADSADIPECSPSDQTCSTSRVPDGVCKRGQCWSCNGDKVVKYSCDRCVTAEEAASDTPVAPAGDPPTCTEEDDGSCTVQRLGTERGIGALFLALGLGAFLLARRRR
jgi:hypothetical protein